MAEASRKKKRKTNQICHFNESDMTKSLFAGIDDDPFALIAGGGEGGFLSLEEVDESDWFVGGTPDTNLDVKLKKKKKKKKREMEARDVDSNDESCIVEADGDVSKLKKKKKNKRKKKEKMKNEEDKEDPCPELVPILADEAAKNDGILTNGNTDSVGDDQLLLNVDEVYAWKELRLHPLLIQSVRSLGFREPTPIQKACIPAAAHQGKDVIGAAETGSGKTLAFGLPILQRLLEEREKAGRSLQNEEKSLKTVKGGPLRALIITPTRELALQVSDHLKVAAKTIDVRVVPIVGGMSSEKQERLLRGKPEIIVGTPGRLWELMFGGNQHLVELHSLSFFVLDEADRMIENGHFRELQSIIDMLPTAGNPVEQCSQTSETCKTVANLQRKKRQTFVFSATIALSDNFRKKLKRSLLTSKATASEGMHSIETLSERAGLRPDAAIVDLTSATIMADKLEESFIECREEDKEAYLYYILSVHGQGRTIVFCTSIAALRRISALLRILGINAWTLHAQMQQRARLKAVDRFRGTEHGVLIATDVAARGLDIPGIRTVVHFQLPHSAEVYIHRSGRTARASADGCCIALISPGDKSKFISLCRSMLKESLRQFPLEDGYLPEVMRRVTLARQIDKLLRKNSQENVKKNWLERNAESLELTLEESGSEEETMHDHKQKKINYLHLKRLQQNLNDLLAQPLQPKTFSRRYLAGAGISPLLQNQLEQLCKRKLTEKIHSKEKKRAQFVVIGQDCVEPLQALRNSGREVCVGVDKTREMRKAAENLKRKRRDQKKKTREQQRKKRKQLKEGMK